MKWCGKSAPRPWQQGWQGKPHREQDQIGTARDVFRIAVRVGRVRCGVIRIPEEWSPLRKKDRTRLTGCLTFSFLNPLRPRLARLRFAQALVAATLGSRGSLRCRAPRCAASPPLGVLTHAKGGEHGAQPCERSRPQRMVAVRNARLAIKKLSRNLERGIPPSDHQHPTASFPRERSDERGKVSQRGVCGAGPSCDGWGKTKKRA